MGYELLRHVADSAKENKEIALLLAAVFGPPWILAARVIGDVVFVAPAELIPRSDTNLEYQARAGGIFALAQLAWILIFGLIFSGWWLAYHYIGWIAGSLAVAGGGSGATSLILGGSQKTAALAQAAKDVRQYASLNTIAAAAAAICAGALITASSLVLEILLPPVVPKPVLPHASWAAVGIAIVVVLAITATTCWIININRYSLHGLYRNRLVRAFLGASRHERAREETKNRFTDFDSGDSPLLHQLWQRGVVPHGDNWQPLQIINVALNLVSSKNLAWQERMAAPFTFSALHSGSGSSAYANGAFRRSYPLDGRLPYGGRQGLTLGTAMAISGAAVSPNMGYNSSPGVAFLMTLFNVRLGWWLGNPQRDGHYWYTGPGNALRPIFWEMFGLTSEKKPWVYLSDGGHFENLGIYEMVRRRCRVIVASDAGCDPDYEFEDLGNALRKIWIDLGVRIDFVGLDRLKKRFKERPTPATDAPYWAVGRISYRDADGKDSNDGWLLYLKSGLHGTEPMDILSYAMGHPTFPHETTANQFFTESQFESYRALGFEIASKALDRAVHAMRVGAPPKDGEAADRGLRAMTLEDVVVCLHEQLCFDDGERDETSGACNPCEELRAIASAIRQRGRRDDESGEGPEAWV
jgi:hypothetical protein